MCVCWCIWVACAPLATFQFVCVFRGRSWNPSWNYWGISWATISATQKTLPTALWFTTEWPTQAPPYSPLSSYRPSSLLRRCVQCVPVWQKSVRNQTEIKSFPAHTGLWQSPRKHCNSSFPFMLGHITGNVITQRSRDSSCLFGAGELWQPWPLQAGDPCCHLDGVHLQLSQRSTSWGINCLHSHTACSCLR